MTILIDPTANAVAGITLDDLVQRVRSEVSYRDELNKLSVDVDEDDTTFSFSYQLSGISRGSRVEIGDEVVYVWDVDSGQRSITVERGYFGTMAESHATGDIAVCGGKDRKQIVNALNDELSALSGKGIYQMRSIAIPNYNVNTTTYAIAELDGSHIYDVQQFDPITSEWMHIANWSQSALDSSVVLPLCRPGVSWLASNTYRVLYQSGFDRFVYGTDDIQADAGLHSECADILVAGAVWRLLMPDEAARNDIYSQGDTRRPDEVPQGAIMRSAAGFKSIRDERINEEKDRLRRLFPSRRAGW